MNLFFTSLFPGINWKAYTKTCTRTKQCKLIADQAYQPVKITAQAAEMPSLDMWGLFEKDDEKFLYLLILYKEAVFLT